MNTTPSGRTIEHAAHIVGGNLCGPLPDLRRQISALTCSSGDVLTDSLFIAIPGVAIDGHQFVDDAFAQGAIGAVVEREEVLQGRPGIVVPSTREAASILADAWYDQPSRELHLVGVTGTNGKSSVAWWLSHLLSSLELPTFCLGTLGVHGVKGRGQEWCAEASLTTPDPLSLHKTLREAVDREYAAGVMEVSSHALHQCRVSSIQFDIAIFTNLTHDHLDYHGTLDRYFSSKKKLFELLAESDSSIQTIVTNADNSHGREIAREFAGLIQGECITYGVTPGAMLRATDINHIPGATRFVITFNDERCPVSVPFLGDHNIENILAVVGGALALGWPLRRIADLLSLLPQVPGRLEQRAVNGVHVYVDYAHTPDALERALRAIRYGTEGRLFVVFGCGGDRDRQKRPAMGQIAREGSDVVVITSDNPRTENPSTIIGDILAGGVSADHIEVDRRAAIEWALGCATTGDSILIAGKGHEGYQIIGRERQPFSDQKVVEEWMRRCI